MPLQNDKELFFRFFLKKNYFLAKKNYIAV